jgi:hypothetical protein
MSRGFKRCLADPCVYVYEKDGIVLHLAIYVDDTVISSNNKEFRDNLVSAINEKYGCKDHGELEYILGLEKLEDESYFYLTQRNYIDVLLKRFDMEDCKGAGLPMAASLKLDSDPDGAPCDQSLYRQVIGGIAYVAIGTRPDICFALSKLSRYLNAPTKTHLEAAMFILRYLKKTKEYALKFAKGDKKSDLKMYVDSDFAMCLDTRRSTSGCVLLYNTSAFHWRSKRQPMPAWSTAEAEYISLAEGQREALWANMLMQELGAATKRIETFKDNKACIRIAENPVLTQRTKSLNLMYHFARHYVQEGIFTLTKIPTAKNLADILTKAVTPTVVKFFRERVFRL